MRRPTTTADDGVTTVPAVTGFGSGAQTPDSTPNAANEATAAFVAPVVAPQPAEQHPSLYQDALVQFAKAADLMNLDRTVRRILEQAKNEVVVRFPVKVSTGDIDMFTGYRVQHNDALRPFKGGLRFHSKVDLDEVRALAAHLLALSRLERVYLERGIFP